MMNKLQFAIFFSLAFIGTFATVSVHNPFYCYAEDPIRPQIGMFSYVTSYETSRGQHLEPNVSSCIPSKFWMVSRHGTRLPHAEYLEEMLENNERLHNAILRNYEAGRTSLCAGDIELLRNWRFDPNITMDMASILAAAGWGETERLARRYQEAYPTLLSSNYSQNEYFFRSTHTPAVSAAATTALAFADGLFGEGSHTQVQIEPTPQQDLLLRPFSFCPLYGQTLNTIEQEAFGEGPEYQNMLSQVSAKLGFHGANQLRKFEVEVLASICRFEQSWDMNSSSPICAAFSVSNFQVIEYYQDLQYYYIWGYGIPSHRTLYENVHCELMQNLITFLQSDDPDDHKARLFFSFTPTLNMLLVTLGAVEDETPLTRHNFAQQTSRLWRSSDLAAMSANIAVIRYE